jgi:RHS repeat-associated protein
LLLYLPLTIISQFEHTVYPTGHRQSMTDLAGTVSTYTYDELYRLTQEAINHVSLGTVINSYEYDVVGNRLSATENGVTSTYSYDMNDRMLTSTQDGVITTYSYDDNGNTLSKTTNGDETTFGYDARNKLLEAVQVQGGVATSNVTFAYDIEGNRIQKTDNGNVINFVVDRNQSYAQVVHELDEQNVNQVTYTHGDDLISQDRSANFNYYNYDGLGSTRSLTDSLGQITDTYEYNAYGTVLDQSGATANSYLYTGEQFDASLGNYYLRARYYDPANGRFTQMDSWMGRANDPITLHKYLYGNGDPVNNIDPSGNFSLGEISVGQSIGAILTTHSITSSAIDLVSMAANGESVSAIGASLIIGLVANKILKPLSKLCKSKKNKDNKCTYAIGWVNAHAQIRAKLLTTSVKSAKDQHLMVIAGVFDKRSMRAAAEFNLGSRNRSATHSALSKHLQKQGMPDVGCPGPKSRNIMGNCAEFLAANKLLWNRGKLKNFVWTQAYRVDTSGAGNTGLGTMMPYCSNCKMTFNLKNRKR